MKVARTCGLCFVFFIAAVAALSREVRYEPETVTLTGKIRRQTFPGPPNYESLSDGDKPETCWILELDSPVQVLEKKDTDGLDEAESDVREVQLAFGATGSTKSYADYKDCVGKKVVASGSLFHSISGHHKTRVLIRVLKISRCK